MKNSTSSDQSNPNNSGKHDWPIQVFAVVSWGCAATTWLARVLNAHPDLFCVHAANNQWSRIGGSARLDGVPYIRVVGTMGEGHAAAGDVHGVAREQIPLLREEFGDRFECAIVVRDPLPRLRSQYNLFKLLRSGNKWGDLSYIDGIAAKAGLDPVALTLDERLMIHGANMLNAITREQELAVVYKSEDLTTNAEVLSKFVSHITRGVVAPGIDWAQNALTFPRLRHRSALSLAQDNFTDWQWHVIRHCVRQETWEAYEALGYQRPKQLDK